MSARILLVEDEPAIRELVAVNLRHAGHVVEAVESVEDAQAALASALPDLVILDWMLPGRPGIELAKEMRKDPRMREVPLILLTARAHEGDKLHGFDVGVDDYVTKPFSPRELVARVRALLRRTAGEIDDDGLPIEIDGLRLDPTAMRVTANDERVELSPTEFRLLHYMMRNPDRALSRERLLDRVWGDRVYIEERTVDVHIRRLRLALSKSGHDRLIETVRGEGYRFLPN